MPPYRRYAFDLSSRVVVTLPDGKKHGSLSMVDTSTFRHVYAVYFDDLTEGFAYEEQIEKPLTALANACSRAP